jgi:uncharacterized protein YndB with AHSA1/START domain
MELTEEELARTVVSPRVIDAVREWVFDAYATPEKLVRWWGPTGFTMTVEEIDLRPGGHWRFIFHSPTGEDFPNHLVFETIDRPRLFVVDHLSHYRGSVTFEDLGDRTRVTMYWTFPTAEAYARARVIVEQGNEGNLDRLAALVAEG